MTATGLRRPGREANAGTERRVQVVDRALAALEELAEAPSGLGVTELGRRLGIDKSSAHRMLRTMLARGFVRFDLNTQRYTLGLRLVGLGAVAARGVELTEIARPHLEGLRDAVGEGASLAVLSEGEVLFLAKAAGPGVLTVNQGVGTRMPVHCSALGKVLLADQRETETFDRVMAQRALTAFTPRTLVHAEELRRHLGLVATRGWAVDDEEYALGLRCIAAPVWDASGRVVAAIGISGPATRVTLERVEALAQLVLQTARAISSSLGYRTDSEHS